jgi:pyruvate dehydrogenase E2 component (dihydrolipoamide acetyltransferase)
MAVALSARAAMGAMRRGILVAPQISSSLSWSSFNARRFAAASLPDHKTLTMPKLSPTMDAGVIQEWVKKEGDAIEAGDVLAEIETDKATMSFEYNDEGYMAKIFVAEGERDVPIGKAICIVVEDEADVAAFADYVPQGDGPPSATAPAPAVSPVSSATAPVNSDPAPPSSFISKSNGTRIVASPLARHAAADSGVALSTINGSGPGGRILAADVEAAIESGSAIRAASAPGAISAPAASLESAHAPTSSHTDVASTKFQRVAADRLSMSKQTIPHYYLVSECAVDKMLALRSALNAKAREGSPRLSVNDFVVKAAAAALRTVPEVNAQWMGDVIRRFHAADICVAVQTPNGLITPIVKDADRKGVREISTEVKLLAERAKAGKLTPEEFMGGTFTISNLGMFGVSEFAAIVNPPQAAILAVGTSVQRVVPDSSTESGFGMRTIMTVTLSCDHRVVDGAVGAQWLAAFKANLEDPVNIIL